MLRRWSLVQSLIEQCDQILPPSSLCVPQEELSPPRAPALAENDGWKKRRNEVPLHCAAVPLCILYLHNRGATRLLFHSVGYRAHPCCCKSNMAAITGLESHCPN